MTYKKIDTNLTSDLNTNIDVIYGYLYGNNSQYKGFHMFDGNILTDDYHLYAWNTGNVDNFIQIHFKEISFTLKKYLLYNRDASETPKQWNLYGSNDGSSWQLLDSQSNIIWENYSSKEFIINNNNSYSYYKMNNMLGASVGWSSFVEMELYIANNRYLIKQNNQYYSIKPEFYQNGQYSPITLAGGDTPNDDDFNNNGIDNINDLCTKYNIEKYVSNAEILNDGKLFTFNMPSTMKNIDNIT